jgi:hypothetical protein
MFCKIKNIIVPRWTGITDRGSGLITTRLSCQTHFNTIKLVVGQSVRHATSPPELDPSQPRYHAASMSPSSSRYPVVRRPVLLRGQPSR